MSVAAGCCGPPFSPRGRWSAVPPREVQAQLRQAFTRWGRPERLRVDNGAPWGSAGDLPTDLALWLIGLGVAGDWNPPRRPQDNGVIERSQDTAKRWAEPFACANAVELQRRLEEMDDVQRREYPSVQGRSRMEAFPELAPSGRVYSTAWERKHWSLAAVTAHLAGYAVRRRVDRCGLVSVYNRNYYVGVIHRGKDVFVMFDPELLEWIVVDAEGRQLRQQPAAEICRERIIGLTVTNRRKRTGGQ
jgi:transposase InsO family protein